MIFPKIESERNNIRSSSQSGDPSDSQGLKMLPVQEAAHRILDSVHVLDTETTSLVDGLGRVLATDVVATMDLPPFSHATVDGFAIHHENVKNASRREASRLRVIETISAGSLAKEAVKPGLAIRVMTGAPLPPGTDAVVKEEDTSAAGDETALIQVERSVVPLENVASAGENVSNGEVVLEKGATLRPGNMGILASLGIRQAVVFQQPQVALLSTGNELVGIEKSLGPGKIFASSFYVLLSKLRESGCSPLALGVVSDDPAGIEERIRSGVAADAIITIGGTRHGDSDWVRDVYRQMEIQTRVDGVAMSPGKSLIFGLLEGKPVFSLPGSPTACIVAFEELVRPALMKMKGKGEHQNVSSPTIKVNLEGTIRGKRGFRRYVLAKVVLQDGRLIAIPINRVHRGALMPIAQANGIVVLPEDSPEVRKGEEVNVRLFDLNL